MNPFDKKKDKLLIELVKNYPVLYDPGNPNFKNCIVKHKVWECISSSMDVSIPDLKRRWKHFRDHYHKKLKAENAGLTTFHTWEYKSHLNFLAQFSNLKEKQKEKEETRLDDSDPDDVTLADLGNGEEGDGEFLPDVPVQSVLHDTDVLDLEPARVEVIPKKKRKKMDTLAAVLESRLAERFRLEPSKEKSPIHKFFESMADIVAEFPPHLAAEARLRVCQLVNDIELKKHSEQHFI